ASRATADAWEGSVLLLHDADDYSAAGSWRRTAAALPQILDIMRARGLQAVAPSAPRPAPRALPIAAPPFRPPGVRPSPAPRAPSAPGSRGSPDPCGAAA